MVQERTGGKRQGGGEDRPRTDLPPKKIPYDDDYFGTGEEEGVERERRADDEREGQAGQQDLPPHVPGAR